MSESNVKGLWIATRCRSIDEFVSRFHPFCDDESIFMATLSGRTVGHELPFAILLRDKTPALRGICIIRESWADSNNPFGRPGVRLGLARLSPGSEVVLGRLLAARRSASPSEHDAELETCASQRNASATPRPFTASKRPQTSGKTRDVRLSDDEVGRPRAPTVEAIVVDPCTPQTTVRVPAIGRATAPLRGIASVTAIAVDGTGVAVQARMEAPRTRPSPRAMTAPLRGDDAPFTSEEPTERMVDPPVMAEGTAPVNLPPSTHVAVRAVTVSGMIQPRTPGSKLVLPANPLMNLTDASLGGFVDSTLDYLLGTEPAPDPEPPREIARGTADHVQLRPILDSLEDEHTEIVKPLPQRRRGSWLVVMAAFVLASGIGFAATYFATTML